VKKNWLQDFFVLIKLRLNLLALLTTLAGFYLASSGPLEMSLMGFTLLGATAVAAGSGALNQWLEVEQDSKMKRTEHRPLPAGRMGAWQALALGLSLSLLGEWLLFWRVNDLTAYLGLAALISYVAVYTPLKKVTSLCTLVGAVPGALPPLMGWTAVRGSIGLEGWVLFAILFLWQMPHFLAIGWMYRDDYERAGFPMLSVLDREGHSTGWMAVIYSAGLLPVSLLPAVFHLSGLVYFWTALALSLALLSVSFNLAFRKSLKSARWLFLASLVYLTVLFIVMVADRT
jgi:protoheme IX farnesyltransferase